MSEDGARTSRRPPYGDGHTVLLVPGFKAGDRSNAPLAAVVRTNGCRPKKWRLGSNEGPTPRVLEGLEERLIDLADRDGRAVTLVGVSLGGVLARLLARSQPSRVRQVITIGSPIRFDGQPKSAIVDRLWKRSLHSFDEAVLAEIQSDEAQKPALTMPATSIYSRGDNVVAWNKSLDAAGVDAENIGVRVANHVGLLIHPGVHLALADRIRQPEGHWRPFVAPRPSRALFDRPIFYDTDRASE